MEELGLNEGDVIEIIGKRTTAARAIRPYGEDEELDIIRLDGLQRANAGVGSGDFVEVRKAAVQAGDPGRASPRPSPISGCRDRPTRSSAPSPAGRWPKATPSPPPATSGSTPTCPSTSARLLNAPAFALQELRLVVVSTAPKGIVHIDAKTAVELLPEFTADGRRAPRRRHL